MGPPLPRTWGIHWPWYKVEVPTVPEVPAAPVVTYPPVSYPPTPPVTYPPVYPAAPPVVVYPPTPGVPVPTPGALYVCPTCGAQFTDLSDLMTHMEEAHPQVGPTPPVQVFTCPTCGAQFSTFEELQAHMAEAHLPEFSVTALAYPPEGGTVRVSKPTYKLGEEVDLTARPNPGYEFSHWEGIPGLPTELTQRFPIDRDMIVTGIFKLREELPVEPPLPIPVVPPPPPPMQYTLTTKISPSGGGSVRKSPDKVTYLAGERVDLTAIPASGYEFRRWMIGGYPTAENPTYIVMVASGAITAEFTKEVVPPVPVAPPTIPQYKLSISVTPSGGGTVSKSPDKAQYSEGEIVKLTATPASGYEFYRWVIDGEVSGSISINLAVMKTYVVRAEFTKMVVTVLPTPTPVPAAQYTLRVNPDPSTAGTVTMSPSKAKYSEGELVKLTAYSRAPFRYVSWLAEGDEFLGSGECPNSINFLVMKNHTLTAKFTM